jgi:RsiW-degrading membrane proteinase PrsW (M82 family)
VAAVPILTPVQTAPALGPIPPSFTAPAAWAENVASPAALSVAVYPGGAGIAFAAPPAAVPPRRESRFKRWRRRNAPKYWWKILLLGLLTFVLADLRLGLDRNLALVPLVLLLASAVVPVSFVVYLWERGAFARLPRSVVGLAFVSGAVLGLLLACSAEDTFGDSLPVIWLPVVGPIVIGLIEEGAKALSLIWFVSDRRLRGELDGLVLGAAAGMGFATLETAGYGFGFFLGMYTLALKNNSSAGAAFLIGILTMTIVLLLRMALAVFGHGVWSAIVGAAIWRERGPAPVRLTWGVALALAISVTLHAAWDSPLVFKGMPTPLSYALCLVVGIVGLWILRFFIREAVERARLGDAAPVPTPLAKALAGYLIHPRRRPLTSAPSPSAPPAPGPAWPAPMSGSVPAQSAAALGAVAGTPPQRPGMPRVPLARGA